MTTPSPSTRPLADRVEDILRAADTTMMNAKAAVVSLALLDEIHAAIRERNALAAKLAEAEDYKDLYETMLSIARQCAGVQHTPIIGWDAYARNHVREKKRRAALGATP